MPLWSKKKGTLNTSSDAVMETEPHPSLTAASMLVTKADERIWGMYPFGDEGWQIELWRLYDLIGEFRFASNWVGNACSRCRIYVADVDENGRVQQETEDPEVAGLADVIFGGPDSKAEAIRAIGVNLTVTGECYVLGIDGGKDPDEWFVVSGSELRRRSGGYDWRPSRLPRRQIRPGQDLIMRLWTPHPRDSWCADSPGRGAMTVLIELERLTRYIFAQIDSRLISAGMLAIPNDIDFPDDGHSTSAAESFTNRWVQMASAPLQGEGTAAGVVPSVIEVPPDALGKLQFLEFASTLSKQAMDLRTEAIRRLALAMDMPSEVLTGIGDITHWSAWFIQESGIKVHIEPVMNRICEALTTSYLKRALAVLGKDPDRYTFTFDTAPLTVRPERLQDAVNLYNLGLLSGDTVRLSGDFAITDKPEEDETRMRDLWRLVLVDPTLFQVQAVRDLLGYPADIIPPEQLIAALPPEQGGIPNALPGGPGIPPPPPRTTKESTTTPVPERSTAGGAPPNNRAANAQNGPSRTASAMPDGLALVVGSEMAVRRALELAGGRLLTRSDRGRLQQVAKMDLHSHLKVEDEAHAAHLLAGAWEHIPAMLAVLDAGADGHKVQKVLANYCTILLTTGMPHEPTNLLTMLRQAGLVPGGD